MTSLIVRLFLKDSKNVNNPEVRSRYGTVSSVVGIICNIILSALKFFLGAVSGSIAITADAVNNLSDMGSSLFTLICFHISVKPADREHPYGHGRIEYIIGLVVSVFILVIGIETLKGAISKIITPDKIEFSIYVVAGLVFSILVKLWMSLFNRKLGKTINSEAMRAVALDSITDVLATAATLAAVVAARFWSFPLDGYMGVIVSGIIIYAGIDVAKNTLTPLLGSAPDPELIKKIKQSALGYEGILGFHDLIVHEYGPGKIFASFHAEVSGSVDIMDSHALIDRLENEISSELGIEVLIHMDPVDTDCDRTNALRTLIAQKVKEIDESFDIHDLRIVPSGEHDNLVFDVAIPIEYKAADELVREYVAQAVRTVDKRFNPKVTIDRKLD